MTPENFLYWLRGYLELASAGGIAVELDQDQVKVINDHLDLAMLKITPEHTRVGDTDLFASVFQKPSGQVRSYCGGPSTPSPVRALTCSAPNIGFRDWRINDPNAQPSIYDWRGMIPYGT